MKNTDLFSGFNFENGLLQESIEDFKEKLELYFPDEKYKIFKYEVVDLFSVDGDIYSKIDDNITMNKIFLLEMKIFKKHIIELIGNSNFEQQNILNKFLELVNKNLTKANFVLEHESDLSSKQLDKIQDINQLKELEKNFQHGGRVDMTNRFEIANNNQYDKQIGLDGELKTPYEILIKKEPIGKNSINTKRISIEPIDKEPINIEPIDKETINIEPIETNLFDPTLGNIKPVSIDFIYTNLLDPTLENIVPINTEQVDKKSVDTELVNTDLNNPVSINLVSTNTNLVEQNPDKLESINLELKKLVLNRPELNRQDIVKQYITNKWIEQIDKIFESKNIELEINTFILEAFKANGFKLIKEDEEHINKIIKSMCGNLDVINQAKEKLEMYSRKYISLGLDQSIKSIESLKKTSVLLLTKTFLEKYLDMLLSVVNHKITYLEKIMDGGDRSEKYLKYKIKYLINKIFI